MNAIATKTRTEINIDLARRSFRRDRASLQANIEHVAKVDARTAREIADAAIRSAFDREAADHANRPEWMNWRNAATVASRVRGFWMEIAEDRGLDIFGHLNPITDADTAHTGWKSARIETAGGYAVTVPLGELRVFRAERMFQTLAQRCSARQMFMLAWREWRRLGSPTHRMPQEWSRVTMSRAEAAEKAAA